MIPTILYLLLRRIRRYHPERAERIKMLFTKAGRIILFIILNIAISGLPYSQEKKPGFKISGTGAAIDHFNFPQNYTVGIHFKK